METSSPSAVRRCSPSRSGPRLTPSSRASSASPSWVPGAMWPSAMASRTRLAIMLAVDSWTTGSNGRRGGAAGVRLDGLLAMRGQPLLGVRNNVPNAS